HSDCATAIKNINYPNNINAIHFAGRDAMLCVSFHATLCVAIIQYCASPLCTVVHFYYAMLHVAIMKRCALP
ncbi:MAG: hypothetical protein RBR35_09815, partial [Salinivirgaceae bacterium]|nr:hypothetical protein [Salinivirgaceae bacterium]